MGNFQAFKEYVSEQAEYETRAYIECLGNAKKALKVKGMDSTLLVITEIRTPFSSSSTLSGF